MINKIKDQYFILNEGNVMTSGNSLNLAKGQMGVFDPNKPSVNGLPAVNSFTNVPKDKDYIIQVGISNNNSGRTESNKSERTWPFKINEIKGLRASAPNAAEKVVDELVIGYNGIDSATAIQFHKGERKSIFVRLSGEMIGALGYPNNYVDIEYVMEADRCVSDDCTDSDCDGCTEVNCAPIIIDAVEYFKNYDLGGGYKAGDVVEFSPVKSCSAAPTYMEEDYTYWTLSVTDTGDSNALALVQAQYPGYTVNRKSRTGVTSVYEMLVPAADADPSDYTINIASILKGCDDCPSGYTAGGGGILYAVSIEDNGTDVSTTVDNLPGYVSGTVTKQGQNFGTGFYTAVVDDELTTAEIASFVSSNPSAIVQKVSDVSEFCAPDSEDTAAWVSGETCQLATDVYEITVGDNECGKSRLAELNETYPELTVVAKGTSKYEVTLSGSSGAGKVTVNGVDYTVTYDTSLNTTAANAVTAHATALLAASKITLTASTSKLVLTFSNVDQPTVTFTNTSGNLAGSVGTLTSLTSVTGGCMTTYQAKVVTSMVCDECSDIYKQVFISTKPEDFEENQWSLVAELPAYDTCLCGIKIKGKEFELWADEDMISGFSDSSVMIQASGGYVREFQEGVGRIPYGEDFTVTYMSKAAPRTHMGGRLLTKELNSMRFFNGTDVASDYLGKILKEQESLLKPGSQYADIVLQVERNIYSQGSPTTEVINYHFLTEYGTHTSVLASLNKLAGAAGLAGVTI